MRAWFAAAPSVSTRVWARPSSFTMPRSRVFWFWHGPVQPLLALLWLGVFLHAVLALRCLANRAPIES